MRITKIESIFYSFVFIVSTIFTYAQYTSTDREQIKAQCNVVFKDKYIIMLKFKEYHRSFNLFDMNPSGINFSDVLEVGDKKECYIYENEIHLEKYTPGWIKTITFYMTIGLSTITLFNLFKKFFEKRE